MINLARTHSGGDVGGKPDWHFLRGVTTMPNLNSLVLVPAWLILFFYATCQAHEKQNLTVVSVHIT